MRLKIVLNIVFFTSLTSSLIAQDWDGFNPYKEYDWMRYSPSEWEKRIKDKYKNADNAHKDAFDFARKNGLNPPDLEKTMDRIRQLEAMPVKPPWIKKELEDAYAKVNNEINNWVNNLPVKDYLQSAGLQILIQQASIIAKKYEDVVYKMLEKVLPEGGGYIAWDPLRNEMIKEKNTEPNHSTLVSQIVEMFLSEMIRKEADGSYRLQRTNLELLRQVGFIKYLQMVAMDWELFKSYELKSLQSIVGLSSSLKSWYQHATNSIQDGQRLYRQIVSIPAGLSLPNNQQVKSLYQQTSVNQLALAEMVDTRRKTLSVIYNQQSDRYLKKAADLQAKINQSNYFKMTEGERIKAQQIVNDYYQEALRLKEKADQLVRDSNESKTVQRKQAAMQSYQFLQSLIRQ